MTPAPSDEEGFIVTIYARGDHENSPTEAIHHGLEHAHRAGFVAAWSDAESVASLRSKLALAEHALEPFSQAATELSEAWRDHEIHWTGDITVGHLRAARDALLAIRADK